MGIWNRFSDEILTNPDSCLLCRPDPFKVDTYNSMISAMVEKGPAT